MTLHKNRCRLLARIVLGLVGLFFGLVLLGWLREQVDEWRICNHFRKLRLERNAAIARVGEGVPLEAFRQLLPHAYFDDESRRWVVLLPKDYCEDTFGGEPTCDARYFRDDGELIKPEPENFNKKSLLRTKCFGPNPLVYYFCRLWYSTADEYLEMR